MVTSYVLLIIITAYSKLTVTKKSHPETSVNIQYLEPGAIWLVHDVCGL